MHKLIILLLFLPLSLLARDEITLSEAHKLLNLKDLNPQAFKVNEYKDENFSLFHFRSDEKSCQDVIVDRHGSSIQKILENGKVTYRKKVEIVGHRATVKFAPENTFSAIGEALKNGADLVELDVRTTKDGVFVILHDSTLNRTTNGNGKLEDYTLAELKKLDAGS